MRQLKPEVPIVMHSALPIPPQDAEQVIDVYIAKSAPTEVLVSQLDRVIAA